MTVFAWIIVGVIAGRIANNIAERNHDLLANSAVGIAGALMGGFLGSTLFAFRYAEGFNLPSVVVATVGAVVLLAIFAIFGNYR
jgi:uncharacterized membrane protein YeaQ/YmgE (transglycosylase-associated protein family)